MPAKSKAQFRAMMAAAHGKSTLGIPKKVGEEFTEATPKGAVKDMPMHVKALKAAGKLRKKGKR